MIGSLYRDAAAALSALVLVVLLPAAAGFAAHEGPRPLTCPPSIIGSVISCSDSGVVLAGKNVTYLFVTGDSATEQFDLVVSLHTQAGDADLVVRTPLGAQLVSMHGSGEDVVFIPRSDVLSGEYLITVVGSSEQSSFKLSAERHERQRTLAPADRAALEQILHSQCCSRPGSCATLRNALTGSSPAGPSSSSGEAAGSGSTGEAAGSSRGSSSSGSGSGASGDGPYAGQDLCNVGRNLCDVQGRLVHLALVNEYMACPFPAALGKLSSLALLDLTMNDLTGYLHREVAAVVKKLPNLQNLLLAHNRLSGSLSCDLMAGPLAELEVAANQLEGTVPPCLVESPTIQELYLANNDISGTLPQPPPDSRLLIISAHSNRLSGTIPQVAAMQQLQALVLHNNLLSGPLPELPAAMLHVNLDHNSLSGPIPEQWGSLGGLEVVRLRHNQLTGSIPAGLAQQEGLELLLLGSNRLAGPLPAHWDMPRLQRLSVQDNALTGPLPASLGALPALAVLQAGQNQLGGSLEAFFEQAAAGQSPLQVLSVQDNKLGGPLPEALRRLPLLSSEGFALLDGVSVPATLDLGGNQLSGPFPAWLVQSLVHSNAAVNVERNRLSCPAEIVVSSELFAGRTLGLECLSADGSTQQIDGLIRVDPGTEPAAAGQPGQEEQKEQEQQHGDEEQQEGQKEQQGDEEQYKQEGQEQQPADEPADREQQQADEPADGEQQQAEEGPEEQQDQAEAGSAEAVQQGQETPSSSGDGVASGAAGAGGSAEKEEAAEAAAAAQQAQQHGSGSETPPPHQQRAGSGRSWAAIFVAAACAVAMAAVAGPWVLRRLQGRTSCSARYSPILPQHSSEGAGTGPGSPLPCSLPSPSIWAKEQQLALLDLHSTHSSGSSSGGLLLPTKAKSPSRPSLPRGLPDSGNAGGGIGSSSGTGGNAAGAAAEVPATGSPLAAEGVAGEGRAFSIGTRVHLPELEPADDQV